MRISRGYAQLGAIFHAVRGGRKMLKKAVGYVEPLALPAAIASVLIVVVRFGVPALLAFRAMKNGQNVAILSSFFGLEFVTNQNEAVGLPLSAWVMKSRPLLGLPEIDPRTAQDEPGDQSEPDDGRDESHGRAS